MIRKHTEFRKTPQQYIDYKEDVLDELGEKTGEVITVSDQLKAHPRVYTKDTSHHCKGKKGKDTMFSYMMYGSICPFCKEQILMVE